MLSEISVLRTQSPKTKPPQNDLGFGKYFTDHMFRASYDAENGWHGMSITPHEPLLIEPGASVLHYGQALFEGMKAFRQGNGDCVLFRPDFNWKRMAEGAERLCMQIPPREMMMEGIRQLVRIDKDWIPREKGSSLYIRPTLIGTESFLGVRPSEKYLFYIICCPVGSYYAEGSRPVKIWVEEEYLRAAPGGLGATKAGANYAASLKAAHEAKKKGFSQVLWLDVSRQYVEEVGTMNVFFVFDDEIVTPLTNGSILPGGVRDSVIHLLKQQGKKISTRKLLLSEVKNRAKDGSLKEIFGTGTAAIISPVGELASSNFDIRVNDGVRGPIATQLYDKLTAIQYGEHADEFGWIEKIK